jgi:hypothetical protein
MTQKKVSKTRQKIHEIYEQNELAGLQQNQSRASSFTVGTTTGGIIEVGMRGDYANLWYLLQPVEAVEMINQLAAAAGIEVAMRPRKDFASWRDWKHTEEELAHYRWVQNLPGVGHPPHANDMAPHMAVGANLPPPEQQPGLQPALMAKETQDEQTVAIEKTL